MPATLQGALPPSPATNPLTIAVHAEGNTINEICNGSPGVNEPPASWTTVYLQPANTIIANNVQLNGDGLSSDDTLTITVPIGVYSSADYLHFYDERGTCIFTTNNFTEGYTVNPASLTLQEQTNQGITQAGSIVVVNFYEHLPEIVEFVGTVLIVTWFMLWLLRRFTSWAREKVERW